jgi:hypothetical protein
MPSPIPNEEEIAKENPLQEYHVRTEDRNQAIQRRLGLP